MNMSVSGERASIYIYGAGEHTLTVTSPAGPQTFKVPAGETTDLRLNSTDPRKKD